MITPQNSSNKYTSFRLAYIYRDYLKWTDLINDDCNDLVLCFQSFRAESCWVCI